MKLQSIQLRHAQHFSDLNIEFNYSDKPITLILGQQSSGKTAILKNIYQALTWFPARFKDMRTAGVVMLDADIMLNRAQSRIHIEVQLPAEIGTLAESSNIEDKDVSCCTWRLYKTVTENGIGYSKVDTQQLEQMVSLYQHAIEQDPLIGLPMIAYFPSDRFVNEMNLISKNNPAVFQNHSAYEIAALPYTTFARFFEWFREISDIENAQTAQLVQNSLKQTKLNSSATTEAAAVEFSQILFLAHAQIHAPSLSSLKTALHIVIPELTDIYLEYQPKLALMVIYNGQIMPFSQLSNSIKNWTAMVGDIVRRMCLLNPKSLFPCTEGNGILLIDNIDAQLDTEMAEDILSRLNRAFPLVQIIATGCNEDLLEHAEAYQYFKLEHRKVVEIKLDTAQLALDALYQDLLCQTNYEVSEDFIETERTLNPVQQLFEQAQTLDESQQNELIKLIRGDDNLSSAKI